MDAVLDLGASMPIKATVGSAGYDLFAAEDAIVPPGTYVKIDTGVHLNIPRGIVGTISHRSGMNSKQGIQAFGQVDSDYTGAIAVTLFNQDNFKEVRVSKGDRIAQMVFVQIWHPTLVLVEELKETDRGHQGFGSTGR
jgi:dUTP pyrophosphatase